MNSCNTTQKTSSMPEPSNKFTVHCDICGEQMIQRLDFYFCYPCHQYYWESELPFFAHINTRNPND